MPPSNITHHESLCSWIVVRPEPAGQFTAQLLGLPELSATAAKREEAIEQVRARIIEAIALGQLVPLELPKEHPLLRFHGWIDPNDEGEKIYLEELARLKAEDLERTLREVEVPEGNPLMKWFGWAKDDPEYALFREEIRRYREEVDQREFSE